MSANHDSCILVCHACQAHVSSTDSKHVLTAHQGADECTAVFVYTATAESGGEAIHGATGVTAVRLLQSPTHCHHCSH